MHSLSRNFESIIVGNIIQLSLSLQRYAPNLKTLNLHTPKSLNNIIIESKLCIILDFMLLNTLRLKISLKERLALLDNPLIVVLHQFMHFVNISYYPVHPYSIRINKSTNKVHTVPYK